MDSFADKPTTPASSRPPQTLALAGVVLGVAAILGVVWLAWTSQSRDDEVIKALGSKLGETMAQSAQTTALVKQLQTQVIESQNRVAQFEVKLAETQTQRIALEEMYRELARAPDDWLLAEVEQTLNIAAQQLSLAGNVRAAIGALQTADARLARADKLQVGALRRAINADLDRLKALPLIDLGGMTVRIDGLVQQVDSLPLVTGEDAIVQPAKTPARNEKDNWGTRVAKDAWDEFKELVRIRKLDGMETGLLTPNQAYFLRENLKLRLLAARISLLARDEQSYREDLKHARAWMTRYFDPKAKTNAAALQTLKTLQDSAINIALPDLNQSLNAVRAARAAREKGGR
jgi:uroporphyrin-3 C-methyltransferase